MDGKKQSLTTRPERIKAERNITPATTATSSDSFNFFFALFRSTALQLEVVLQSVNERKR